MTWEPELWWGGCGHAFRKLDTCVGGNKVADRPSCQVTTRNEASIGTQIVPGSAEWLSKWMVDLWERRLWGREEALSVHTLEVIPIGVN